MDTSPRPLRVADRHQARLGFTELDQIVHILIDRGVSTATLTSYESGKRCYLSFCTTHNLTPLPVDEPRLLRFVASLFESSLSYQSIRSYLSAVRHLLPDPAQVPYPRLNYALKGIRREGPYRPKRTRLPITPELLKSIYKMWSREPLTFDRVMLWAAFCLGFGFMRSGEFTCISLAAFSSDMLSPNDITVDSHTSPSCITVLLKRSKNDPFGVGTTLHLGATGSPLCPITSMLGYLAHRPGPLFLFKDGSPLSRSRLISSLRTALRAIGVDDSGYSGHSFRIGAATTAAMADLSDSLIQTLGRWRSSAFSLYICTPGNSLQQLPLQWFLHPPDKMFTLFFLLMYSLQ